MHQEQENLAKEQAKSAKFDRLHKIIYGMCAIIGFFILFIFKDCGEGRRQEESQQILVMDKIKEYFDEKDPVRFRRNINLLLEYLPASHRNTVEKLARDTRDNKLTSASINDINLIRILLLSQKKILNDELNSIADKIRYYEGALKKTTNEHEVRILTVNLEMIKIGLNSKKEQIKELYEIIARLPNDPVSAEPFFQ